jgi:myo-inositol-hexaphosphate 3-phosphohydrolase
VLYAFVNRRDTGDVVQLKLLDNSGKVGWETVRTFSVPVPDGGEPSDAQCEGMVVDDALAILYVGQEDVGIWKYSAKPDGGSVGKLIHATAPKGAYLEADVEGLTIYHAAGGKGYLLASSQGNNTFAVFTREGENTYLGSFQITKTSDGTIDGAQESDGAMVLNVPLGPRFPNGLLVVQDGFNEPAVMVEDEGETENVSTNFKFIGWDVVAKAFATPLVIDTTSYDPRKPQD